MGADMLLYSVPYFEMTRARVNSVRVFLRQRSDVELCQFADAQGLSPATDADNTAVQVAAKTRQYLYMAVQASLALRDARDVIVITFPGMDYSILVTGGLSCGDLPTEAAAQFEHVDAYRELWLFLKQIASAYTASER